MSHIDSIVLILYAVESLTPMTELFDRVLAASL